MTSATLSGTFSSTDATLGATDAKVDPDFFTTALTNILHCDQVEYRYD